MIVTKKYVYKINKDKMFRNFVVLSTVLSSVVLVHRIMNEGISWLSTTGLLG
jgi:hypothetical protein